MPVRTQEQLFAMSFGAQTNISTTALIAKFFRLNKLNAEIMLPQLGIEDDAPELGKGHEFATQTFKTAWGTSGTMNKYLSSHAAAWVLGFGLGKVVVSGSGPYVYAITPLNPTTDGVELPYFSGLYQLRPATPVVDIVHTGLAIEDFSIDLNSGPGRQNSQITCNWVSSGLYTSPSGLTIPAATAETLLPAGIAAITLNGVDYVANKGLISLKFTGKNNLQQKAGIYIGAGFQSAGVASSGAVLGRLEIGQRAYSLSFVARLSSLSAEFAALVAQTTGTATITMTVDANNAMSITFNRMSYKMTKLGESDTFVTVQVDADLQFDSSLGVLSASVTCPLGGIAK